MKKLIALMLLAVMPVSANDYQRLFSHVAPMVVSIENDLPIGGIRGSGVFISDRHILTCAHMINNYKDSPKVYAYPFGLMRYAKVIAIDKMHDLAILVIDQPITGTYRAHFADSDSTPVGTDVLVVGNGLGLSWTANQGIVSGLHRLDRNWIQTDALVNPGNSGCPAFNRHGQVVGIVVARIGPAKGVPGTGFFIPSNTVSEFIERCTISWVR